VLSAKQKFDEFIVVRGTLGILVPCSVQLAKGYLAPMKTVACLSNKFGLEYSPPTYDTNGLTSVSKSISGPRSDTFHILSLSMIQALRSPCPAGITGSEDIIFRMTSHRLGTKRKVGLGDRFSPVDNLFLTLSEELVAALYIRGRLQWR
jgi:hypothetical protein